MRRSPRHRAQRQAALGPLALQVLEVSRQIFVEWAALTIPRSYWANEFYKSQRARGATHEVALRALAFRWARILFRCWKDGSTYDNARYLKHLKIRKSPLITGQQIHAQPA